MVKISVEKLNRLPHLKFYQLYIYIMQIHNFDAFAIMLTD